MSFLNLRENNYLHPLLYPSFEPSYIPLILMIFIGQSSHIEKVESNLTLELNLISSLYLLLLQLPKFYERRLKPIHKESFKDLVDVWCLGIIHWSSPKISKRPCDWRLNLQIQWITKEKVSRNQLLAEVVGLSI